MKKEYNLIIGIGSLVLVSFFGIGHINQVNVICGALDVVGVYHVCLFFQKLVN